MPSTNALGLLVRKKPLSEGEWYELIEHRRQMLLPHLNKFSLAELGQVKWYGNSIQGDSLKSLLSGKSDSVVTKLPGTYFLGTRGIFMPTLEVVGNTSFTWGIAKDGTWLLCEGKFEIGTVGMGYEDGGDRIDYTLLSKIIIEETDPATIVKLVEISPLCIWNALGSRVREWVLIRDSLYRAAQNLHVQFCIDDAALEEVPS